MKTYNDSASEKVFRFLNLCFLSLFSLTILYPFAHVASSALSANEAVLGGMVTFYPVRPTTEALRQLLVHRGYQSAMLNTVFITCAGTVLNLFVTAMLAYPLSRRALRLSKVLNIIVLFPMFFSGGMIPTYLVVSNLGLTDTYWAYLLPALVSPFYCLLLRNFFASIPKELEESAIIDGAGYGKILISIIMPLSMAAIATIGLFYAVDHWNVFLRGIMYINDRKLWTLQMFLREMISQSEHASELAEGGSVFVSLESLRMAAILVSILPILCVYPFVQKYFVKGVMVGSVKG
ncbi:MULTISPECIES: carbohydrate ABC transporter permease [Sphaerochaeta]|jgi:putative aldouronate transport system permease protein|nr:MULTISPECIES: carbohydrate ABC transporter permease [Sphaerochaeta]MDX9985463.1 carbohydrate ABC transporter permease [Sphaerochaeta sp.]MEA5028018.1 carbohydrate ABC transporter permease [Sphaerochaeta associata]